MNRNNGASHGLPSPQELVGTYRRFGESGPVYKVVRVIHELENGDALLQLSLPEAQTEMERRYSRVVCDPEEN